MNLTKSGRCVESVVAETYLAEENDSQSASDDELQTDSEVDEEMERELDVRRAKSASASLHGRRQSQLFRQDTHTPWHEEDIQENMDGMQAAMEEMRRRTQSTDDVEARKAMMFRPKSMHKWTDDAMVRQQKEMKQAIVHLVKTQLKEDSLRHVPKVADFAMSTV